MTVDIRIGDCRSLLTAMGDQSVNCVVTSPPYFGLRDYGVDGQIGLEQTPDEYVAEMVAVFRDVRRVLRDDGTLWLNLADSYAANTGGVGNNTSAKSTLNRGRGTKPGHKYAQGNEGRRVKLMPDVPAKNLLGIPWRVAFALQADGWYLRQDVIWSKPNPMPESVRDRCTKSHEYIFLLSKSPRYYYNAKAIAEPLARPEEANRKTPAVFGGRDKHVEAQKQSRLHSGNEYKGTDDGTRNRRSVWTVSTKPFKGAHFATFPPDLIEPCILAGCPEGGTVLDPFGGAGTTGLVAKQHGRNAILLELNPEYAAMARERIDNPPAAKRKRAVNDNNRDLFTATDTPVSAAA